MTTQGNAAILFADIAGSSRLYKALGDTRAREIVGAALLEMSAVTAERRGTVIKTIGDEIMAAFETAEDAVEAAISMQHGRRESEPRTEVRIGVHFGPTLRQEGDVFGEAVNDAAHLVSIARAGQIITSEDTVEALPEHLRPQAHRFDRIQLKGSREMSVIYRVEWQQAKETTTGAFSTQVISAFADDQAVATELELSYKDERLRITPEQVPFVVGRDPGVANLSVPSHVASRDHFRIEYRRGKFVLADNSTNGTWVQLEGQDPVYLRREEVPLTGAGTISVGQAIADDDPHLIRFTL